MDVHQILQDLFGYASDEEPAPSHEIEQQPEFNFDEDERGSELTNDAASSQQVEIDCGYLEEGGISSCSSDEAEREKQIVTEQGIKAVSGAELNHDGGVECEDKSSLGERVGTEGGTELNHDGGVACEDKSTLGEGVGTEGGTELNHDGGVACEDKSTLGEGVGTEGGTELNHDGGVACEDKSTLGEGVGTEGGTELNHDGGVTCEGKSTLGERVGTEVGTKLNHDGGVACEDKSTLGERVGTDGGTQLNHDGRVACEDRSTLGERVGTEGGTELNDGAQGLDSGSRSSSLTQSENSNAQPEYSEVMRDIFGDSDFDDSAQDGAGYTSDQEKHNSVSPVHKSDYEQDLESEVTLSCEQAPFVPENEKADDSQEDQSVSRVLVLEIPKRTPHGDPSQVARSELPDLIGFVDKPFDPETYVEQEFYATDASGTERLIPPTNIIHWKHVINDDGTTSVQSNARIVDWSDGTSQLLIGNEAFDIIEEDITQILSRASLWNEGIYQTLRKIMKSAKVASSSSATNPKSSTTQADHQNTTTVPETVEDQLKQAAAPQTTEDCPASDLNVEEFKPPPYDKQDVNPKGPKDPQ